MKKVRDATGTLQATLQDYMLTASDVSGENPDGEQCGRFKGCRAVSGAGNSPASNSTETLGTVRFRRQFSRRERRVALA